jgi:hypothetical protein
MGLDFLRRADWLDTRVRGYLLLLALLNLATLAFLLVTSHGGIDRNGFLLGTDFLSFWTAGQMLHGHGHVYDAAAHIAAQRAYFAQGEAYTAFFYPPLFLPFCYQLGYLHYFPALAAWLLITGAVFVLAVRLWAGKLGLDLPLWTAAAAFPAVLITITHGQTSFLAASFLAVGALRVSDRPWLAGILFGLAAIKPQFGLLVPLVLLLTGEWRVIVAAAATVALLALAAAIAFGPETWPNWLAAGGAAQTAMAGGIVPYAKMQSLFAAARLLGAPLGIAYALQAVLTLAVAGAVAWASWRRRYDPGLGALMLTGALLATPFVLDYDMVLLAFPLIYLAAGSFRPWDKLICALAFVAPAFARPLAMELGVPIMPLVLIAFFVVVLRRTSESPAPAGELSARGSR